MAISARNQLNTTVKHIQSGAVNDVIKLCLTDGDELTAVITSESTKRLNLAVGSSVVAIFKAPSVIVATDDELILSSRNQLQGTVESITDGAVNAEIAIKTASGTVISAIITSQSCQNLNLAVGSSVTALIKASHIVLGVKK